MARDKSSAVEQLEVLPSTGDFLDKDEIGYSALQGTTQEELVVAFMEYLYGKDHQGVLRFQGDTRKLIAALGLIWAELKALNVRA